MKKLGGQLLGVVTIALAGLLVYVLREQQRQPGHHNEIHVHYECDSYTMGVDFYGGGASGTPRRAIVYKNGLQVGSFDFDGKSDVANFYTDSGSLPTSIAVIYEVKLYRQDQQGEFTILVDTDLLVVDEENTCTATPTWTVEPSPTSTVTEIPPSETPTPTNTVTEEPTATDTATPTETQPTATGTVPTPTKTATVTQTATETPSPTASASSTVTQTPTPTETLRPGEPSRTPEPPPSEVPPQASKSPEPQKSPVPSSTPGVGDPPPPSGGGIPWVLPGLGLLLLAALLGGVLALGLRKHSAE